DRGGARLLRAALHRAVARRHRDAPDLAHDRGEPGGRRAADDLHPRSRAGDHAPRHPGPGERPCPGRAARPGCRPSRRIRAGRGPARPGSAEERASRRGIGLNPAGRSADTGNMVGSMSRSSCKGAARRGLAPTALATLAIALLAVPSPALAKRATITFTTAEIGQPGNPAAAITPFTHAIYSSRPA